MSKITSCLNNYHSLSTSTMLVPAKLQNGKPPAEDSSETNKAVQAFVKTKFKDPEFSEYIFKVWTTEVNPHLVRRRCSSKPSLDPSYFSEAGRTLDYNNLPIVIQDKNTDQKYNLFFYRPRIYKTGEQGGLLIEQIPHRITIGDFFNQKWIEEHRKRSYHKNGGFLLKGGRNVIDLITSSSDKLPLLEQKNRISASGILEKASPKKISTPAPSRSTEKTRFQKLMSAISKIAYTVLSYLKKVWQRCCNPSSRKTAMKVVDNEREFHLNKEGNTSPVKIEPSSFDENKSSEEELTFDQEEYYSPGADNDLDFFNN